MDYYKNVTILKNVFYKTFHDLSMLKSSLQMGSSPHA